MLILLVIYCQKFATIIGHWIKLIKARECMCMQASVHCVRVARALAQRFIPPGAMSDAKSGKM